MIITRLRPLILLFSASLLFIQLEQNASATCSWAGQWQASTGVTLNLTQSGVTVEGTYSPGGGEIAGFASGGFWEGSWSELPNRAPPNHAGQFEANISPDCNSFSGRFRDGYSNHGLPWMPWSGTRIGANTFEPPSPPPGNEPGHHHDEGIVFDWQEGTGTVNGRSASHGSSITPECGAVASNCLLEFRSNGPAKIEVKTDCVDRVVDLIFLGLGDIHELGDFVIENDGNVLILSYAVVALATEVCASSSVRPKSELGVFSQQSSSNIHIDHQGGVIDLELRNNSITASIETSSMVVRPNRMGKVVVGFDPSSQRTIVQTASGGATVEVFGGSNVSLSSGQQVEVTPQGAGPVTAIGSSSPGPPSNRTVARSGSSLKDFDINGNNVLDESEFFQMVDAWLAEQISNELFFTGVDFWISQQQIVAASVRAPAQLLKGVRASFNGRNVLFEAQGRGVSRIAAEIYDPHGALIYAGSASGSRLSWQPQVANGVYFYRLYVGAFRGKVVQSELRKIAIIR